jgi:Flp pilus assembly protein TadD
VVLERARAIFEAGGPSATLASSHQNLGVLERDQGNDAVARGHYEHALATWTQVAGADSPQTALVATNLGRTLIDAGDPQAAVKVLEPASAVLGKVAEKQAPHLFALAALGLARAQSGDVAEGVALVERAYALSAGSDPGIRDDVGLSLGRALVHVPSRHAEGRVLVRVVIDGDYLELDKERARRVLAALE